MGIFFFIAEPDWFVAQPARPRVAPATPRLGNERDDAEVARVLGCKAHFDLNYNNHRMADVSLNELIGRVIFLIRLVKADTVVGWDPWAHDEENQKNDA